MSLIQDALLALEQKKKTPLAGLLEGFAGGFSSAQDKQFENAKNMILIQQELEDRRRREEQDKQMRQMIANQTEQTNKLALGATAPATTSPLPSQRLKMGIETDAKGYLRPKFETVEPKADSFEDFKYKDKQGKVRIGLMNKSTGERRMGETDPLADEAGGGITPSLQYQMQKDAEKKALEAKGLVIPGYELTGQVQPDEVTVRSLRSGKSEFDAFKESLTKYKGLIQKYGTSEISDRYVQGEMKSLAKNLQLKVKNLAQLGVLSASDVPFIEEQISEPKILATKGGSLGRLDTTLATMESAVENKFKTSGYRKVGGENKGDASGGVPKVGELFNNEKVVSVERVD